MCGRYSLFLERDIEELNVIIAEVNALNQGTPTKTGEVSPSDLAPILVNQGGRAVTSGEWGFPGFRGSSVIFNARAETAMEKKMFAESLVARRCVIPSTGFYEWKTEKGRKHKYLFFLEENQLLYMAGFYKEFEGVRRFVILTTAPNASVADVHDRMPVVLLPEEIDDWLMDGDAADRILHAVPPLLSRQVMKARS